MKILSVLFLNASGFNVQPAVNNWLTGHSGEHLECFPNHYIDGTCKSTGNDECSFHPGRDGQETREQYAFGIHW